MKGRGEKIAAQVQESGSKRERGGQAPRGGPGPGGGTPGVREGPAPQPLAIPVPEVLSGGTERPGGMSRLGCGAEGPRGGMGVLGRGPGEGTAGSWERGRGDIAVGGGGLGEDPGREFMGM